MSIPAGGGSAGTTTVDPPSSSGSDGSSKAPVTHHFHLPWWPEGDPGKLRAAASSWRAAQRQLTEAAQDGSHSVEALAAENVGETVDAIRARWSRVYYSGACLAAPQAGAPAFDNLIAGCGLLAQACDDYADHIDSARHKLEELAAELVAGLVVGGLLTFVTAGLSDAAAAANAARVAAEALDLALTLERALTVAFRIGGMAIQGAVISAGSDLEMQAVRHDFEPNTSFDLSEFAHAAGFGALTGPVFGYGSEGAVAAIRAVPGFARGSSVFLRGLPDALGDSLIPGLVTPDGVVLGWGVDSGPLRELIMEARAAGPGAASGGGAGWIGEGGLTLTAQQNAAVEELLQQARTSEPRITAQLQSIVDGLDDARLVGLEYRLKSADSLKRKVATQVALLPEIPLSYALTSMKDIVRYTLESSEDSYVADTKSAIEELESLGFEPIKLSNTWGTDGYKGINSFWRDASTGQIFELQFHTPASFSAKMDTHELYEAVRLPGLGADERERLEREMSEIFAHVIPPPGAIDIGLGR